MAVHHWHYAALEVVGTVVGVLIDDGSVLAAKSVAVLYRHLAGHAKAAVGLANPCEASVNDSRDALGVGIRLVVDTLNGVEHILAWNL